VVSAHNMGKYFGKCLCESVVYEISGELGPVFNCHCSKCRRWHGAPYRTRASIRKNQFVWIKGENNLSSFNSSENVSRYFCKTCGSPLVSSYKDNPDIFGLALGQLEGLNELTAIAHIHVDSKASWYEIKDGLPQYPKWPKSEAAVRETSIDVANYET